MQTVLFWNTFGGDLAWFRYSAASFTKFARGRFNHVACLVPSRHRDIFRAPCEHHGITLLDYADWPESSFNHHQVKQWEADILFPGYDAIFHIDADTVFTAPVGPENWMRDGKLICPFVHFSTLLTHSGRQGGWQWKLRADASLGIDTKLATMTGFPMAHYSAVYAKLRQQVNSVHKKGYLEHARKAHPTFPQGICDFETLGAVAQNWFKDSYHWLDLTKEQHPSTGFLAQCHSPMGLDATHNFGPALGGVQTPRQLFASLGL